MQDYSKPGPVAGTLIAPVGVNSRSEDGTPDRGRILVPPEWVGRRVLLVPIAEPGAVLDARSNWFL